ncbi:extensin family protein [Hyphomonas sp. WL0036]|uniref:extensin-like domain-containing protein n=1 Tax=Hyphomonas sediminis TaxID=2866160 RepID=UPI001C7F06C9|nr:extensin family protein [Hyphomonas sediminis]MBY9068395.1 extensin family protein [Hyphomonas sediminis]
MRGISILLTYAFLLAAIIVVLVRALPARHNPFAPIDLTARPGIATTAQLSRLKGDREACFTALDTASVQYTPLEDTPHGKKCGLFDALTLDRTLTPYSATLQMTCAETAAVYMWERHVVRPAAVEIFGSPVARIETYGSFSCRNIAGTRRLSQHAFGNAIDVSGFRLEDGRVIDVKAHWGKRGKEGRFLKRVHSGACELFSVTLGPEYNAAHADHFHMDMGPGGICR